MANEYPNLKTIMLVDDDTDDQEFFEDALRIVCADVTLSVFENGVRALEHLERSDEKPELIFLDLNMPLMDGQSCLRHIKANDRFRDIPVIMFSTSAWEETVDEAYAGGASLYAVKPNDFGSLRQLLKRILDCYAQRRLCEVEENFILKI